MATSAEGFQSDNLRAAFEQALAGKSGELERLLSRLGAAVTAKPNVKLAAAFGVEVADLSGTVAPLLRKLGDDDAAPDTDRVFLPIAAAYGWAARIRAGRELNVAWHALAGLAADERAPVRLGTREALRELGTRDGGTDDLVARAVEWLDLEDREVHFGAAATIIEAISDHRLFRSVRDHAALLEYLSRLLAEIAAAPRSAERSDGRRRLLMALPACLALVLAGEDRDATQTWFEAESAQHDHPAVRKVMSDTLAMFGAAGKGKLGGFVDELRSALEGTAKPLRDPTRLRPGAGRGKSSRRIR